MPTFADTIKKLAEKSGIDITTEEHKLLLEEAAKIELPENTDLLSPFILKTDAKNDPEIKNHFYGAFTSQIDSALLKSFGDLGLSKDALDDLKKTEPNTFKRIDLLTTKLKDYQKQISDPSVLKGEKDGLQKKVSDLESQITTLLEVHENEKKQLVERNESDKIDYHLKDVAREFKLIDSIPSAYKDTVMTQSIQKALADNGVKPILRDGKLVLVNAQDTSLAAKEGITLKSIVEKGFANDKLLDLGKGDDPEKIDPVQKRTIQTDPVNARKNPLLANLAIAREMNTVVDV